MYRIGLTGGIASGKSTVATILREMGVPVINLDQISREIMHRGTPAYREVLAVFGQAVLTPDQEIDRKALGKIVFSDPEARQRLEGITHPRILQGMEEQIAQLEAQGSRIVVIEVPLLIEGGRMHEYDEIWLVYVDEATQLARLQARDTLDESGAMARIAAQIPLEEKKVYADHLIINTGAIADLKKQIEEIWREVQCKESL